MVVLSELSSLFVKIPICDALSSRSLFNNMMHAKWMRHVLTPGIRTKLSSSTKSVTVDKFIAKTHKEAVSNLEIIVTK